MVKVRRVMEGGGLDIKLGLVTSRKREIMKERDMMRDKNT
jgi:hypothetical protein